MEIFQALCSKEFLKSRLASLFGATSQLDDGLERNETLSYRPPKQPEIHAVGESKSSAFAADSTSSAGSTKSNVLHAVAVHAYLL